MNTQKNFSPVPPTEKRIAKVTNVNPVTQLAEGVAEGMTYKLVTSGFATEPIKVGDYVVCHVFQDAYDEDFYLEQIPNHPFSNEEEWEKQEVEYR